MNLGDGLKLELHDGKPKLILSDYGLEPKNSKKNIHRTRTQKFPLKSNKLIEEPVSEKAQRVLPKRSDVKKMAPEAALTRQGIQGTSNASGKAGGGTLKDNTCKGQPQSTAVARKLSAKKSEVPQQPSSGARKVPVKDLRDSLVCLTQEQLQQILSTISQASKGISQDQDAQSQPLPESATDMKEDGPATGDANEEGAAGLQNNSPRPSSHLVQPDSQGNVPDTDKDDRANGNGFTSGLFSNLGEREREKETLEAKRAQWKKELDEQMALKKQQQKASSDVHVEYNPWGRPGAGAPAALNSGDALTTGEEERAVKTAPGLENTVTQSTAQTYSFSHPDLPAAIRSAFVLGEAAPMEHAFSAHKREQQKQWLLELDRQREETKLRKIQERRDHSQTEDHERWAMHFDSLQKRTPAQLPLTTERAEQPSTCSHAQPLSVRGALSTTCDGANLWGGDNLGRASVDSTTGPIQKTGHLRTMTALLDPVQIEERERNRLKQVEHQRAIEAQVAERQRQRQREEEAQRAEEQREEQRLAHERELLQRQYESEAQRLRQKEESHSRKTEELHQSVQRAQEEARQAKQQQRIRDLARKGHDTSHLQRSLEGAVRGENASIAASSLAREEVGAPGRESLETPSVETPRKDTAVQTDVEMPSMGYKLAATVDRGQATQTPDVPVEYRQPSSAKKAKREPRPAEKKPVMGKENVYQEGGDPYEAFTRTDRRQGRPGQRGGRRPEWNTKKPSKPFVPASGRYPQGLQQERQESRLRRQLELLTLAERNAAARPTPTVPSSPHPPHRLQPPARKKEEPSQRKPSNHIVAHTENRALSPPVPAVMHRLHQLQYRQQNPARPSAKAPSAPPQDNMPTPEPPERPPSSHFIPYVRTDEVYQLDPHAPLSRPPTQGSQHKPQPDDCARLTSHNHARDPLLHPELLKNRDRQQAILKGLSELRQGLLQKQRELETGFSPLRLHQEGNPSPPF
ncbi:coiled-coil domain-containing protein 66 isoform X2 [Amia ocellicauda]|uniref:coiled-coil domain-containing protein 66 isoform X2 n=1 Tax=Amia ocellicauda TaxID=2972642 RepID=UPI003463F2A6